MKQYRKTYSQNLEKSKRATPNSFCNKNISSFTLNFNNILLYNIVALSVLLAVITSSFFASCDSYPSYIISTMIIIIAGAIVLLNKKLLSYQTLLYIIIFTPALTPFYAFNIERKSIFAYAAQHLQNNMYLIDKTTYLFALASFFFTIAVIISYFKKNKKVQGESTYLNGKMYTIFLPIVALMVLISIYIIESGPTIFQVSYKEISASRAERTTLIGNYSAKRQKK